MEMAVVPVSAKYTDVVCCRNGDSRLTYRLIAVLAKWHLICGEQPTLDWLATVYIYDLLGTARPIYQWQTINFIIPGYSIILFWCLSDVYCPSPAKFTQITKPEQESRIWVMDNGHGYPFLTALILSLLHISVIHWQLPTSFVPDDADLKQNDHKLVFYESH